MPRALSRFLRRAAELFATIALIVLCSITAVSPSAMAQASTTPMFSQSDLDQMLAPIALYPDDLLGDVLAAATYPLEVVQADRFVKQNPSLQGNALADALNTQPWDASVKSLAQYPSVLAMMDDELNWTQQLGDAFLAQRADVMDTVQDLRAKADANGSLQSSPQQSVVVSGDNIDIQPATPDVVYVPYYDPAIVYGIWWWPAQRPIFWTPPQNYRPYAFGNISSGVVVFGPKVTVTGTVFNHYRPNWGAHSIAVGGGRRNAQAVAWQHDPAHRGNLAYRTTPSVNLSSSMPASPRQMGQQENQRVRPAQFQQGAQAQSHPAPQPMQQPVPQATQQPRPMPQPAAPHVEPARQTEPARAAAAPSGASSGNHGDANHGDPHKPNNN